MWILFFGLYTFVNLHNPTRSLSLFLSLSTHSYGVRRTDSGDGMSGLRLLTVTLNMLRKRRQLLILPITMFIGLEEAFLAVDYTRVSRYSPK